MRVLARIAPLIALIALIATVSARTAAARAARPADLAAIHTMGVVSNLGDEAEIKVIGVTVFGNRLSRLSIADWGLNDLATARVVKHLSGRFAVKPVVAGDAGLANVHDSAFKSEGAALGEAIRALPPSDIDAYLVIQPESETLAYPSNQAVSGVGLYGPIRRGGVFDTSPHPMMVHVIFAAYVLEAKSGRLIARAFGETASSDRPPGFSLAMDSYHPYPHAEIAEGGWSAKDGSPGEADLAALRDACVGLLEDSLDYTLDKIGLGD